MDKRKTIKKTAALLLSASFAVAATGCDFLPTNTELDMKQVVATVDISDQVATAENGKYASVAADMKSVVSECGVDTDIQKSELVSYFLSVGTSYVEDYGMTYRQAFTTLMNNLTSRKVMVQYAMVYFLAQEGYSAAACKAFVQNGLNDGTLTAKQKELLSKHPEILTMKYFLTANGTDNERFNKAVYALKSAVNESLDSMEKTYIVEESKKTETAPERKTPENVDVKVEDYYAVNYEVYTGRNAASACGEYEAVDGSTQATRLKAYNQFLSNLDGNHLLLDGENTSNFLELDYYYVELSSQLEQALITMLSDTLTEAAYASLTQSYVEGRYAEQKVAQERKYTDASGITAFETAIGEASDTSFVMYSPAEGFGFVYNILIPFSTWQTQQYAAAKNRGLSQDELYATRASILSNVKAKDLRGDWFTHEGGDYNYAFEVTAADEAYTNAATATNAKNYLFFENNVKTDGSKYEDLGQYAGKYAYNGTVSVDEEGNYECKPNAMTIDEFLVEMNSYLNFRVGAGKASGAKNTGYVTDGNYTKTDTTDGKVYDYSEFMYYTGSVDVGTARVDDYFNPTTDAYKAVSAVNELMFAYSTDSGCLNTYLGYDVSPYGTDFVKEFEYAAQYAINQGAGTYAVCASDYGWHIVYASYVYELGDVYDGYVHADREVEGTFSYLYYEFLKTEVSDQYMNEVQSAALDEYNKTSVTLYEERYEDLLSLGE